MLNPVALSIITNTFTDQAERARAIGMWGAVFGISMALGPIGGGAIIASVGWRGIFWVNIPIGVAAIILTAVAPRAPEPAGCGRGHARGRGPGLAVDQQPMRALALPEARLGGGHLAVNRKPDRRAVHRGDLVAAGGDVGVRRVSCTAGGPV
jgi:MFS family permease